MSLYFVYTPSIKNRRADYVFYFENSKCFLMSNNNESNVIFDAPKQSLDAYKNIVRFAERNKLSAYEVLLSDIKTIQRLLKYFSNYLSEKDLSIGLLTTDINLIEDNQKILDDYGITTSNVHSDFIYSEKTHISYKPRPNRDVEHINGGLDDELYCPRFSVTGTAKKIGVIRQDVASAIKLDESFHDKFMKLLIESGKDNVEVYKKAGVSRQVFSRIISDKNMIPTKLTLISLCIGLELSLKVAKELMESAGYSLSKSIMLDAIVMKYMREEIFDFDLINSELDEYGCQLLGWHPREN